MEICFKRTRKYNRYISNRESGLDVCGGMEICFPLELSQGFQASRLVEIVTWASFLISNWGIRTPFVL